MSKWKVETCEVKRGVGTYVTKHDSLESALNRLRVSIDQYGVAFGKITRIDQPWVNDSVYAPEAWQKSSADH